MGGQGPGLDAVKRLGEVDHEGSKEVKQSSFLFMELFFWQSKYLEIIFARVGSSQGEGDQASVLVIQGAQTIVIVLATLGVINRVKLEGVRQYLQSYFIIHELRNISYFYLMGMYRDLCEMFRHNWCCDFGD